jgi:hypothetical protein
MDQPAKHSLSLRKPFGLVLDMVVRHAREPRNRKLIQEHFVDPVICHVIDRMYPYIVGCATVFMLILLFIIIIIFMLVFDIRTRKRAA